MNNELMTDEVYSYSDKEVFINDIITNSTTTFFLNRNGFADSSQSSSYVGTSYYLYDNDYLISYGAKDYAFHCYYTDGNRTKVQAVQYSCEYQYNSAQNIIDLESFKGSYLGKLNKNLIRSRQCTYLVASDRISSVYEYQYNSDGLVIKRTETITSQHIGQGSTIVITDFEYVIID
jgi:hypothetical protein